MSGEKEDDEGAFETPSEVEYDLPDLNDDDYVGLSDIFVHAWNLGLLYQMCLNDNTPLFYKSGSLDGVDALEAAEETFREIDSTETISMGIRATLNEFEQEYDFENSESVSLKKSDSEHLKNALNGWNDQLKAALNEEIRIPIRGVSVVDVESLADSPQKMFPEEDVWQHLPSQAKQDLLEASRALGFNLPTSTVVMSLRAVEMQLHSWYTQETGRDVEDRTFGQILSELNDQFSEDEEHPIMSHLDYLKVKRNESAHPETTPSLQEAESTLIMARETLTKIDEKLD
jgi:hypothetical protein